MTQDTSLLDRKAEYLIDFSNGLFYDFQVDFGSRYDQYKRNQERENEGYKKVSAISRDKIDKFSTMLNRSDFLEWKPSYLEDGVHYSDEILFDQHGHPTYISESNIANHRWFILVCYTDGTHKEIRGQDIYPPDWNTMFFALNDLTGTQVLELKMKWTEVFYERFKAMITN